MSQPSKVYVRILQHIESLMIEGYIEAGDKLPSERELAEKLGVGRSSVREALRALELLDLIETRKGEGTFLRQAGSHRLAEVLAGFFLKDAKARQDLAETRRILEVEAVKIGCERVSEEQLQYLKELLDQSKEKWNNGYIPVEEDIQFHKTIVSLSQNNLILNIWRPLVEYSRAALKESLSREGRMPYTWSEHEEIYNAIAARDSAGAGELLSKHLYNSSF
ncbi:FadR/GntR family transcriptional regulator [Alkalicoccus daliensis]|uniref:Transcriptional regulator, GntR family n=1 Tax=Alkalicoccus daliensis TaxID=745820 RepID=A0A1H0CCE3_9BACI|nr:FadR/GntR family transcriptional regulator [Alkalicoccus daliensis]SDN55584.1 transcriptional regulator, GntR family [Alkalicoccus daliensis]